MRHRERSGKDSACLAILSLTIAEKKRFGRRIIMSQTTGLAYKQRLSIAPSSICEPEEMIKSSQITP